MNPVGNRNPIIHGLFFQIFLGSKRHSISFLMFFLLQGCIQTVERWFWRKCLDRVLGFFFRWKAWDVFGPCNHYINQDVFFVLNTFSLNKLANAKVVVWGGALGFYSGRTKEQLVPRNFFFNTFLCVLVWQDQCKALLWRMILLWNRSAYTPG